MGKKKDIEYLCNCVLLINGHKLTTSQKDGKYF